MNLPKRDRALLQQIIQMADAVDSSPKDTLTEAIARSCRAVTSEALGICFEQQRVKMELIEPDNDQLSYWQLVREPGRVNDDSEAYEKLRSLRELARMGLAEIGTIDGCVWFGAIEAWADCLHLTPGKARAGVMVQLTRDIGFLVRPSRAGREHMEQAGSDGLSQQEAAQLLSDLVGCKPDKGRISREIKDKKLEVDANGRPTESMVARRAIEILKKKKPRPQTRLARTTGGQYICPKCGDRIHKLIGADKVCRKCFLKQNGLD